uniref:Uncharacterized protein n=1 Tax=viral metagenome TaxID=1070528 RepID=A0A6M3KP82_9ZZZZ
MTIVPIEEKEIRERIKSDEEHKQELLNTENMRNNITENLQNEPKKPYRVRDNDLPPVPPRPEKRYQMRQYYDDNKEAILADLEHLGEREMRMRWNISQATWRTNQNGTVVGLSVRWGLIPGVLTNEPKPGKSKTKSAVTETVTSGNDLNIQLAELRGWQAAAREFMALKG